MLEIAENYRRSVGWRRKKTQETPVVYHAPLGKPEALVGATACDQSRTFCKVERSAKSNVLRAQDGTSSASLITTGERIADHNTGCASLSRGFDAISQKHMKIYKNTLKNNL